jgi:hypothetical protein
MVCVYCIAGTELRSRAAGQGGAQASWGYDERGVYPAGKPWDRQPISGKLRRKFGVCPGFAAYFGPLLKTVKHRRRFDTGKRR